MNKRIFDDFPTVDCNQCEIYYLNQCDGVVEGQERPCTAFKATRHVLIPQEIARLRTRLKWLYVGLGVMGVFQVILTISILILYLNIFGGLK